jgi:hypothetical protein
MAQVKKFFEQQSEEVNTTIRFMESLGFECDGKKLFRGHVQLDFYHPLEDMVISIMADCPIPGEDWTVLSLKGLGLPKTHKTLVDCLKDHGLLGGDQ